MWRFFFWSKREKKEGHSRYENEFWRETSMGMEKYLRPLFHEAIKCFIENSSSVLTKKERESMKTPGKIYTYPYKIKKDELH